MSEVVLAACPDGLLGTDLRTSASVATFDDCAPQARALGLLGSSSGHVYAAHGQKALWFVWAWGERRPKYRGTLPERMSSMTFTADAALCFGGARSGSIYVWLTSTGRLLRCWPAHCREVTQLEVSQDQSFLISGSSDATVHLYGLADIFAERAPKPLHSWAGHSLPVTSLAFLPGVGLQQTVATASLDQSVRLWDIGTGKPLQVRSYASPVNCISVGPGGASVLCACKNGELRSFNPSSAPGQEDGLFTGHTGPVSSCSTSSDGSFAASCSEVDCVRIWELRTRQCISQAHTGRNMQVSSVQIVQRPTHPQPLPLLQPLQKLLTATEDIPDVPVASSSSCAERTREELQAKGAAQNIVDRIAWAKGCTTGKDLAGAAELAERCEAAEASQARWAAVAGELYAQLVELGVDAQAPRLPVPAPRRIPAASPQLERSQQLSSVSPAKAHRGRGVAQGARPLAPDDAGQSVEAAWADGEDPVTAAILAAEQQKRSKFSEGDQEQVASGAAKICSGPLGSAEKPPSSRPQSAPATADGDQAAKKRKRPKV